MVVFKNVEVCLTDASEVPSPFEEYDTEITIRNSSNRGLSQAIRVKPGRFGVQISVLPAFIWGRANSLEVQLDFDAGEQVNGQLLYILKDEDVRTSLEERGLRTQLPVLQASHHSGSDKRTHHVDHILLPNLDINAALAYKHFFNFVPLRSDEDFQIGKTCKGVSEDHADDHHLARVRVEVKPIIVECRPMANGVHVAEKPHPSQLRRPPHHQLRCKSIILETRIERDEGVDDDTVVYQGDFRTKPAGLPQLNFVFVYRDISLPFEKDRISPSQIDFDLNDRPIPRNPVTTIVTTASALDTTQATHNETEIVTMGGTPCLVCPEPQPCEEMDMSGSNVVENGHGAPQPTREKRGRLKLFGRSIGSSNSQSGNVQDVDDFRSIRRTTELYLNEDQPQQQVHQQKRISVNQSPAPFSPLAWMEKLEVVPAIAIAVDKQPEEALSSAEIEYPSNLPDKHCLFERSPSTELDVGLCRSSRPPPIYLPSPASAAVTPGTPPSPSRTTKFPIGSRSTRQTPESLAAEHPNILRTLQTAITTLQTYQARNVRLGANPYHERRLELEDEIFRLRDKTRSLRREIEELERRLEDKRKELGDTNVQRKGLERVRTNFVRQQIRDEDMGKGMSSRLEEVQIDASAWRRVVHDLVEIKETEGRWRLDLMCEGGESKTVKRRRRSGP